MNALDYILDAVLVATVFVQFRGRRLTPRNLGLPVAIVVYFLFAHHGARQVFVAGVTESPTWTWVASAPAT